MLGVGAGKGGEGKRERDGRKGREGKGRGRRRDGTTPNKELFTGLYFLCARESDNISQCSPLFEKTYATK